MRELVIVVAVGGVCSTRFAETYFALRHFLLNGQNWCKNSQRFYTVFEMAPDTKFDDVYII
jgi:hypothetical protein